MKRDALIIGFVFCVLTRTAAAGKHDVVKQVDAVNQVIGAVQLFDMHLFLPVTDRAFIKIDKRWREVDRREVDRPWWDRGDPTSRMALNRLGDPGATDVVGVRAATYPNSAWRTTTTGRIRPYARPIAPVRVEVVANLPVGTHVAIGLDKEMAIDGFALSLVRLIHSTSKYPLPTLRVTRQDASVPAGEARLSHAKTQELGSTVRSRYYMSFEHSYRQTDYSRARVPIVRVARK